METEEVWKDLPDYPPYEVSNLGRVRKPPYTDAGGRYHSEYKIMHYYPHDGDNCYRRINMHIHGVMKSPMIHALVLHTFVSPHVNCFLYRHKDGNMNNNSLDNLQHVDVMHHQPGEEWRMIERLNGTHMVSNYGRIKRLDNFSVDGRHMGEMVMKTEGHDAFTVTKVHHSVDVDILRIRIDSVVAHAFLGACPEGQFVKHIDGNMKNNRADNLEYFTVDERKTSRGRHNPNARLGIDDVMIIRERYQRDRWKFGGVTMQSLANEYGVHLSTISLIISNKRWVMGG